MQENRTVYTQDLYRKPGLGELISALLLLLGLFFYLAKDLTGISSGLSKLLGLLFSMLAILLFSLLRKHYRYRLTSVQRGADMEDVDLVITEERGKREATLARLSLFDLLEIIEESNPRSIKAKTANQALRQRKRIYHYTPTPWKRNKTLLVFRNVEEDGPEGTEIILRIEPDPTLKRLLQEILKFDTDREGRNTEKKTLEN